MIEQSVSMRWTVAPGNNQFAILFDSTRGPAYMTQAAIASGSAYFVPGPLRGKYAGCYVKGTILCTGQNVTLLEQSLTGSASASTDWETEVAGTITVTAGAGGSPFEWKPACPDWRLRVDAGGTGPTTLVAQFHVTWTNDYGA